MVPIYPSALGPGDTIAFVAPAGRVDHERVARARRRLQQIGFQVRAPDTLRRTRGYLAGDDSLRAQELMAAFADRTVAAVFPVRGGYGSTRILDRLDYDFIRDHPKVITGFSDITALHLAIQKMTGMITFHSPNPMDGLGMEEGLAAVSAQSFWRALRREAYFGPDGHPLPAGYLCPPGADFGSVTTLVAGTARGRLTGGNLSLVCALMGTPFEIDTDGRVLLLEDTGESPYRIDRYLSQLRLAGKLNSLAAVIVGQLTGCDADHSEASLSLDQVLRDYLQELNVPVMVGFPTGHAQPNVTLPLGALVEVDADDGTVLLLENPVALTESLP